MLHGTELISAIEGFFHTQQRYSTNQNSVEGKESGLLVGLPDMRDDTAARFAAGKFRKTFRSLRPLLADDPEKSESKIRDGDSPDFEDDEATLQKQLVLTKSQLDERAKFFSALLIEEWIRNPGNVRLLRIAFDLYPDHYILNQVLNILRPGWESNSFRGARREVRTYCLSELFRAGATETGFVQENESLPAGVSIDEYHRRLVGEAQNLVEAYIDAKAPRARFPWYLMQQVLLYLAARNAFPRQIVKETARGKKYISLYWKYAKFMFGEIPETLEQRSIFLVIAKTAFGISSFDFLESKTRLSDKFLTEVNRISPHVAHDLWLHYKDNASEHLTHTAQRLGIENQIIVPNETTIADVTSDEINPFYEEENLMELACWLLSNHKCLNNALTPWNISCVVSKSKGYDFGKIKYDSLKILKSNSKATHLFSPPDWCETRDEILKYKIGLLLRFALRGSTDLFCNFTLKYEHSCFRYNKPISHWEQQKCSSFQGRDAFGPPWLPISSFTEDILFELLRWPGSGIQREPIAIDDLLESIKKRVKQLRQRRGKVTSATFLEQKATWPGPEPKHSWSRNLRVGIVQSIIPDSNDFKNNTNNPELLNNKVIRTRQKAHLAAIMEGVGQMLRVRNTHRHQYPNDDKVIDLLIFPELAVHPHDIDSLILPFVQKHKCIVLFGQVYHPKNAHPNSPLINSCLWMIPEWNKAEGLKIRRIEQGKKNLAKLEATFSPRPVGFRPVQWLIEYQWHSDIKKHRPLILSASVCYDATDLALASDLRSKSDLYIICALNCDVGTFDRMSEGLHYHMYQGVIVVNNGQFGGSSFFMPFDEPYHRQIFHLHGQPQASIAFAEICPKKLINRHNTRLKKTHIEYLPVGRWKTPPAGLFKKRH